MHNKFRAMGLFALADIAPGPTRLVLIATLASIATADHVPLDLCRKALCADPGPPGRNGFASDQSFGDGGFHAPARMSCGYTC